MHQNKYKACAILKLTLNYKFELPIGLFWNHINFQTVF